MRRRALIQGIASLGAMSTLPAGVVAATQASGARLDSVDLEKLAKLVRGVIYVPGTPDYERLRRGFAAKVDLHPTAIVHALSSEDVAATVDFAQSNRLPLAVRGGGHSYAGYNSCDSGLVVDLSGLNRIVVDADLSTARVGGGTLSGAIEAQTAKSDRATVLGQCPSVGVGGFLLGGGVGPLMSRHGLGCDNVISAEVVLADGRIVTASQSDDPDLFWAIRGGGGNFGVATAFTVKLHPVTDVLAGYLEYGSADARDLLYIVRDLAAAAPAGMTLIAVLSRSGADGFSLSIQVCHVGEQAPGQAAVEGVLKSAALRSNGIKSQPYLDLERMVPSDIPPVHWENSGGFFEAFDDELVATLANAIAEGPGVYDELSFIHLHSAVTAIAQTATAFPMRRPGFAYGIASSWLPSTGASAAASWVDRTAGALSGFGEGAYVNVMGREGSDSVRRAYDANYSRLASIKARYDPQNLFSINQNIRPAAGPL